MAEMTMTVPEAAKALGISKDLAYKLIREGRFPHIRWGGRLLVPRAALEEHLAQEAAASLSEAS